MPDGQSTSIPFVMRRRREMVTVVELLAYVRKTYEDGEKFAAPLEQMLDEFCDPALRKRS